MVGYGWVGECGGYGRTWDGCGWCNVFMVRLEGSGFYWWKAGVINGDVVYMFDDWWKAGVVDGVLIGP